MVLLLSHEDVCASVTMQDAIVAMEEGFREQGEGGVVQPPRLNTQAGKGWLRLGPAVMERSGWMGFKAMNLAPGHRVVPDPLITIRPKYGMRMIVERR